MLNKFLILFFFLLHNKLNAQSQYKQYKLSVNMGKVYKLNKNFNDFYLDNKYKMLINFNFDIKLTDKKISNHFIGIDLSSREFKTDDNKVVKAINIIVPEKLAEYTLGNIAIANTGLSYSFQYKVGDLLLELKSSGGLTIITQKGQFFEKDIKNGDFVKTNTKYFYSSFIQQKFSMSYKVIPKIYLGLSYDIMKSNIKISNQTTIGNYKTNTVKSITPFETDYPLLLNSFSFKATFFFSGYDVRHFLD